MRMDGYDKPIKLKAALTISRRPASTSTSPAPRGERFGINVPICYTDGLHLFGVKCLVAPGDPEQRRLARAVT